MPHDDIDDVTFLLELAELDQLTRIDRKQDRILRRLGKIMAEIDDLNGAVTNLQNSANTIIAKLDELKNAPAGVDPAAVSAAAVAVQAVADSLTTAAS